jgi:hypothetical protein
LFTGTHDHATPAFALLVRAGPGVDEIRALRAWLKVGLPRFGLHCITIEEDKGGLDMFLNLNDAERQSDQTPAPAGLYRLRSKLMAGSAGPDGLLRRSKHGATEMLDLELTITEGEYAGRKWREMITVNYIEANGPFDPKAAQGFKTAVRLGRTKLRAIIESARGLDPKDESAEAERRRHTDSPADFDNLTFIGQVEVKPAQNGYRARNYLDYPITPDMDGWKPCMQEAKVAARAISSRVMDDDIPF